MLVFNFNMFGVLLMKKCVFCNIDNNKVENTIIEETNNFYVIPCVGALVEGYLLIVSKRHIFSMSQLSIEEQKDYINLLNKYREKFKSIYNKYPIIFEHGSSNNKTNKSANSVFHAHTHIVNHEFSDEKNIIKDIGFNICNFNSIYPKDTNYIYYINNNHQEYVSYTFEPISQLMRIYIAKDLNLFQKYDWRKEKFENNIIKTISRFK